MNAKLPEVLIIGATGFVGSRLVRRFIDEKTPVRVLSRASRFPVESNLIHFYQGDLENRESLKSALEGVKTIFYLAHAMSGQDDYEIKEKLQAENLKKLLNQDQKVIYLGALIPDQPLSKHLTSRENVAKILRSSEARITEFKASIILGRGSASYEMIRGLVYRLPFLLQTNWTEALCQPIAIDDVVEYLFKEFTRPPEELKHKTYQIGGSEVLKYRELMSQFAKFSNLRRPVLRIPLFPKALAEKALPVVVPEWSEVGIKLLGSIELDTVVEDQAASVFKISPMSLERIFSREKDPDLEQISLDEIIKFVSDQKEIPAFLKGQYFVIDFEVPEDYRLKTLYTSLVDKFKFAQKIDEFVSHSDELSFKIPLTGEFQLQRENQFLILKVKPALFFQKWGWGIFQFIWKKVINS